LFKYIDDLIHIATASYFKLDAIVSWNFKRLVNLKTINAIHKINIQREYNIIEELSIENLRGNLMATYKNDYSKEEDCLFLELHEIRYNMAKT
jgi:hypothetical protein